MNNISSFQMLIILIFIFNVGFFGGILTMKANRKRNTSRKEPKGEYNNE